MVVVNKNYTDNFKDQWESNNKQNKKKNKKIKNNQTKTTASDIKL